MTGRTSKLLAAAVIVAMSVATLLPAVSAEQHDVLAVIESARQALASDQFVEAGKNIDEALQMPEFAEADRTVQFHAFLLAAFAASGRQDNLGAHEFMSVATEFPDADQRHWLLRARFASWVDAWPDAGLALTTVAKRWPDALTKPEKSLVATTAARMDKMGSLKAERLDLLNALFAANYVGEWEMQPSGFWSDLVSDALERGALARAREVSARIDDPDALTLMRSDKRFDPLVSADPRRFNVRAAAERQSRNLRSVTSKNPRSLGALVQYSYALLSLGEFTETLKLAGTVLDRVAKAPVKSPAYDDIADSLNWIYDQKYLALRALGRWDEALAVLEQGREKRENGSVNVSQAINLGFYYLELGRPADALKSLDGIDWAHSLSGYGRMQLQHVRYRAFLRLGNTDEADKVFAYLRENKDDAEDNWQLALLDAGDVDGAAELLIARLHDVSKRSSALLSAQTYSTVPHTAQAIEDGKRWQALLARDDVKKAIDEVGRREIVPLYDVTY